MNKLHLLGLLAVICLTACADNKTAITITGELGETKPTYLYNFVSRELLAEGQVADGCVTFTTELAEPVIAMLGRSADGRQPLCPIIIDGKDIELNIDKDGKTTLAKGSAQNMQLDASAKRLDEIKDRQGELMKEYTELYKKHNGNIPAESMASLETRYKAMADETLATIKQIMSENADNLVPIYYLTLNAGALGTEYTEAFLANYVHKDSPMLDVVNKTLNGSRNKMPGATVVDFVGKDLKGNECRLTDYVGKGDYVLVDFWASWCGPCRAEMPNVKTCYEKYHEKGFNVVGISFDNSQEAWEKGVKDLGITWPQISDLKGWECAASDIFYIKSIPATILYGPDGKVIKANLRGEELGQTLEEIFKESTEN